MSRLRIALPILISSISIPALAEGTAYCQYANWHTPQCDTVRMEAFARARNAEVNASIARVKAERVRAFAIARNREINASMARVAVERKRQLALSLTQCKTPNSTTPRCLAERAKSARAFEIARNAEIDASMARVNAERARAFAAARNAEINASVARVDAARSYEVAMTLTHCKTPDSATPRCEAERAREFAAARNAEIVASIARVKAEREFEHARNAEIDASMARVAAAREHDLALTFTHCKTSDSTTPRCEAERDREFAAARNAEIEASMAIVGKVRAFAKLRNDEVERSLAAAKAERARKFAISRNAEIEASLARVAAARVRGEVVAAYELPPLETGAINLNDVPTRVVAEPVMRRSVSVRPCREARYLNSPLHFSSASATIEDDIKSELDLLVVIAHTCPSISISIHGHSDSAGAVQVNRSIAQRRARAAVDYLVANGVDRKRLTAIGHGSMEPIMPNTSEANRAVNRRVEIDIKDPAVSEVAMRIMGDLAELLDPTYRPQLARLTP